MASIVTALFSETIYAVHQHKREQEREAERQCWKDRIEREREGRKLERA